MMNFKWLIRCCRVPGWLIIAGILLCQSVGIHAATPVYVTVASHNERSGSYSYSLLNTSATVYQTYRNSVLSVLDVVSRSSSAYDHQSDWRFL